MARRSPACDRLRGLASPEWRGTTATGPIRYSLAVPAVVHRAALLIASASLLSCTTPPGQPAQPSASSAGASATNEAGTCPARSSAPELLPGTRPEHATLAYWLARHSAAELDAPLLSAGQIADYNARVGRRPGQHPFAQRSLGELADPVRLRRELSERLAYMRDKLDSGSYVGPDGSALPAPARAAFDAGAERFEQGLRVALAEIPIRCGPFSGGLYKPGQDHTYDRNACSTVRPQEAVHVLAPWSDGLQLVQTRYALGWISSDASLGQPVARRHVERVLTGPRVRATAAAELEATDGTRHRLGKHTTLPLDPDGAPWVADAQGFHALGEGHGLVSTARDLTRRRMLEAAFAFLDSGYGFGGSGGGRDCSRLQLDLFESFGVALPRHSGWQARAGTFTVDVSGHSEAEKLRLIDGAAKRGALLLHFPGHIMLHLGKTEEGTPMALHALGEYVVPCAGGSPEAPAETVVDVQRTVVSDLELGRGSSRRAFIERLTTLIVLGAEPGPELASIAQLPPAPPPAAPPEDCRDSTTHRIFISPRHPVAGRPLRLIATTAKPMDGASLWVFGPDGARLENTPRELGGGPFTQWTRVERPAAGRHTAVWTRGDEVVACKRLGVRRHAGDPAPPVAEGPVWEARWSWERDTENLWSAFVEQLFDYPEDDGRTWTNLHDLLRDPDRNLLHDHLGLSEDRELELVPDCADLPYVLRGYFAWKLKLPFAYRQCSRGRPKRPPSCGPLRTNRMDREHTGELASFAHFINRKVRRGVHSASGRTVPDDDKSDLYPVALERASLPPGTIYADPYGHVMILTRWFEQGRPGSDYGLLMAAEAQPDGTVGRRRFFRGSFLFDPSTVDVGAGFKQFRPIVRDDETDALVALDNAALAGTREHARFSREQYGMTKDDFYERMDALINPEPLDAQARLVSLVDAFEESVRRRVIAVSNGEEFMAARGHRPIEMPVGHDIFETVGPWEDYSTPSRDMRLLISLDTVTRFPGLVARHPQRFKLADAEAGKRAGEELETELKNQLAARMIEYRRSDGSAQRLSLQQVRERAGALEVAYNPNDCVEVRWAAPEGSEERATCKRAAPADQRTKMTRYRPWFTTRTRPPRGAQSP